MNILATIFLALLVVFIVHCIFKRGVGGLFSYIGSRPLFSLAIFYYLVSYILVRTVSGMPEAVYTVLYWADIIAWVLIFLYLIEYALGIIRKEA